MKKVVTLFVIILVSSCKNIHEKEEAKDQNISEVEKNSDKKSLSEDFTSEQKIQALYEKFQSASTFNSKEIIELWRQYTNELNELDNINTYTISEIENLLKSSEHVNYYDHKIVALLAMATSKVKEGKLHHIVQLFSERAEQTIITKSDLIAYHSFIRDFPDFKFKGDELDIEALKKLSQSKNSLYKYLAIEISAAIIEGQDAEGGASLRYEEALKEMLPIYISFFDEKDGLLIKQVLFVLDHLNTDQSTNALKIAADKFRNHKEFSELINEMLKKKE